MKLLTILLSLTLFMLSCSDSVEKPSLSTKILSELGSRVLTKYLECAKPEEIKNSILLAMVKEKGLGDYLPCEPILNEILPRLLREKVIPSQWECKASKVDLAFSDLSAKICSKI